MGITLRNVTGSALTYDQMDENFRFLSQSYFYLSGSNVATGNLTLTGSLNVSGSSVVLNTSAFTVADNLLGDPIFVVSATSISLFGTSSLNGITRVTGSLNISGSTIMTGSLNVSGGITGSLLGTASIASSVTPLSQSVVITGSLIVSNSIDSSTRSLYDSAGTQIIDWETGKIDDSSGVLSIDWANRKLFDGSSGQLTIDWENNLLIDSTDILSIDWKNRTLSDTSGSTVINYSDQNNIQVTGNTTFTGSVIISGSSTFTNIGPAVFTGSMTTTGSNTLIGNTVLSGSVNFSGSTTFNGTHIIQGNTTLSGSIIVSGSATFSNTIFTVTGSQFYTGSSVYIGDQTITGSLSLTSNGTGTGLFINGQKQFNYLSAYHTASILPTQNVSGSFIYNTVTTSSGITITNNSRITFANTGIYNIQFSAQIFTQTGANVYIWFKKNGVNISNSATRIGPTSNNEYVVAAWNFVDTFTSGSYVEIAYQSDQTNTQFQYAAATGNIPAIPSIIATVTQVA